MLNRITIQGRMVREPELRYSNSGTAIASFTIACDRDFGDKQTDFIDIVAFKHTAEFISKFMAKGRMALVTGRLQIREWQDKEGHKRRTAEVVADSVYFGDSKKDTDKDSGGSESAFVPYEDDGDLPWTN